MHEFPTLPMNAFVELKTRFSNRRKWRDFVAAVQCSVNYSTVVTLRSATVLLNYAWARASGLSGRR
jgi:hypothetical protein